MVPARIQEHSDASIVTRIDHVGELVGITPTRVEVVRDGLVIKVPFVTVGVLGGGRNLDIRVALEEKQVRYKPCGQQKARDIPAGPINSVHSLATLSQFH